MNDHVSSPRISGAAGFALAILTALIVLGVPGPETLAPEGQRMAAIFAVVLVLWVTEAVPVAVTALLAVVLQPMFRVGDLPTAFSTFISPVFFFVLAMFVIAQAFISSGLDRRFALWLLDKAGTDSRRVVLVFMGGTALVSTIMSDVPATAIFMAVSLGLLEKMGLTPGKSSFAKALMIGIPFAALIGGVATPAGSSINILGIFFIQEYGDVTVRFLDWMVIGIPMVLVMLPVSVWVLLRWYPPEMTTVTAVGDVPSERAQLGPVTAKEWRVLAILATMIVLWILSTWVEALDVVLVSMVGAIAMFLPGMQLFTWKEAERGIGWEALLMVGGVTSIGAASVETGLAQWLVDGSLGGLENWGAVSIVALVSAFTVVIHLALPIGPVINSVLIPPLALLALSTGQNPALYALPVAFTASCAFLLPLDAVPLVTYGKGYYRMLDMFVPGAVVSLVWVVLITALLVVLGPVVGLL
ncbi:MAG: carboxylate transporter [Acidobacteria bacterium]|jgi:sodium-dependent dicarboxylate transporter 2/3/5|nr:carboxylate transporter [Acidobacteriota bacterium]MDP7470930.1 DASS family sodium-coupled anion symporter [Vicinamibacterales bacterium]HJN43999.1 DASS family sodium-coupled anion symporter [Vicinamibacterales bacterium]|tara:strand:+ start:1229 stop:2641 length:1413 start_codon:yes stop_codon:yes gene_type:complete